MRKSLSWKRKRHKEGNSGNILPNPRHVTEASAHQPADHMHGRARERSAENFNLEQPPSQAQGLQVK
jgi:hypothetical protein